MSGPTPITSPFKIVFPYVVTGFQHKLQVYLSCAASLDPSGFDTVARSGYAASGVSFVMTRLWNLLAPLYSAADTAFGNATLQQKVGPDYIDVFTEANLVSATALGSADIAFGIYVFMYGPGRDKMPLSLLEGSFGGVGTYRSYAALPASLKPLVDAFTNANAGAIASDPYAYRQFRGGGYARAFKSLIGDSNEKMRRKRGLK